MDDSQALESNAQPAKVVQPTKSAFHNPSGLAEAATMKLTATGDLGGDARLMQLSAVLVVVVAAIGLYQPGLGQGAATYATDRCNGLDKRDELGDVIAVGAREDHRERDALRFSDEMVLGARASAIGGIRSCF